MSSRENYDMHLNKRKNQMFRSVSLLWLQTLTRAASTDNWHNPPSDGASVSVFKTRFLMKPLITLFLAVVQPPYFKSPWYVPVSGAVVEPTKSTWISCKHSYQSEKEATVRVHCRSLTIDFPKVANYEPRYSMKKFSCKITTTSFVVVIRPISRTHNV